MKIFISIRFKKDGSNEEIIGVIKDAIKESGNTSYSFVDEGYIPDAKEMMKLAFSKMNECDMIVCEASECAFGVGIEAGYFYAKGKKVISFQNEKIKESPTMSGTSDVNFMYKNPIDLKSKLIKILK